MEFVETMRQAHRMCMTYLNNCCQHCPLCDENGNCEMDAFSEKSFDAQALESTIMDWAKKNLEPAYPSWKEWHQATFGKSIFGSCPNEFGCPCPTTPDIADRNDCARCVKQPIPAEIAEKLGIKPVVREGEP